MIAKDIILPLKISPHLPGHQRALPGEVPGHQLERHGGRQLARAQQRERVVDQLRAVHGAELRVVRGQLRGQRAPLGLGVLHSVVAAAAQVGLEPLGVLGQLKVDIADIVDIIDITEIDTAT